MLSVKSMAYQSLQPSPMEPAWIESTAGIPSGVVTKRFDSPWVNSWYTVSASFPESPDGMFRAHTAARCRYICMIPGCPSGSVEKFALLTWPPSGNPFAVLAPSMNCPSTGSLPSPSPVAFVTWKLPAASVKAMGGARR